jgi:hypothetical protein
MIYNSILKRDTFSISFFVQIPLRFIFVLLLIGCRPPGFLIFTTALGEALFWWFQNFLRQSAAVVVPAIEWPLLAYSAARLLIYAPRFSMWAATGSVLLLCLIIGISFPLFTLNLLSIFTLVAETLIIIQVWRIVQAK